MTIVNYDTPPLSVIGKIVATLILGAKRIKEQRKVAKSVIEYHECWSWRKFRKTAKARTNTIYVSEVDVLSEKLLDDVAPQTLNKVAVKRLGESQFGDFFVLTTSLSEINLLKRTKEVETASGG